MTVLIRVRHGASQTRRGASTPHATLGNFTVLPKLDGAGHPIPNRWVLPGCWVVETDELYLLAKRNNWPIVVHL